MKVATIKKLAGARTGKSVSEILILADGKILAHNITPTMASVLSDLNPADEAMSRRAPPKKILT